MNHCEYCIFPIFTARVAKRAKDVITGICHSVIFGGGEGGVVTWDMVTTPAPLPPPGTWSQHPPPLPHLGHGHNTPAALPPPHLGHGHNTRRPPPHLGHGHNTRPLPPGTMRRRAVRILLQCILVELKT